MDAESTFLSLLAAGVAHCKAVGVEHGSLLLGLFLMGLLGSAGHCTAMCGPFVLSQTVSRLDRLPASEMREWHRLAGAALLPYHLGRATTYAALGAMAAQLAGGVVDAMAWTWVPPVLLAAAACVFLAYGLARLDLPLPRLSTAVAATWSRLVGARLKPLFTDPRGWRGYGLGLALGFLPCGLLYGAIAAAAATGTATAGAMAMLAFVAGTVPALLAVGLAGHLAARRWQKIAAHALPMLMLINAAVLAVLAWRVATA